MGMISMFPLSIPCVPFWTGMSCYLGNPDVNFVEIAKGFDIDGAVATGPDEFKSALARAAAVNREGRPFMIDAAIARRGPAAKSTWHPAISIAGLRG